MDIEQIIDVIKNIILANKFVTMGFCLLFVTQCIKEFLGVQLKIKLIKDQVLIVPFVLSAFSTVFFIWVGILDFMSCFDGFGTIALTSMGLYGIGSRLKPDWFKSSWEINGGRNKRGKK